MSRQRDTYSPAYGRRNSTVPTPATRAPSQGLAPGELPRTPSSNGAAPSPASSSQGVPATSTSHSQLMDLLMDSSFEKAVSTHPDRDSNWLLNDGLGDEDQLPELPGEQPEVSSKVSTQYQQPGPAAASAKPRLPSTSRTNPPPPPEKVGFFGKLLQLFGCKSSKEASHFDQQAAVVTPRKLDSARSGNTTARSYVTATSSPAKPPLPDSHRSDSNGSGGPVPALALHKIQQKQDPGRSSGRPLSAVTVATEMTSYRTEDTDLQSPIDNTDEGEALNSGRSLDLDRTLVGAMSMHMDDDTADWLVASNADNDLEDLEAAVLSTPKHAMF